MKAKIVCFNMSQIGYSKPLKKRSPVEVYSFFFWVLNISASAQTAKEDWEKLETEYNDWGIFRRISLKRRLLRTKCKNL
jgi:hypothetical protein